MIDIRWRESNPGWLSRLYARMQGAQGLEVAVGFPKGKASIGSPYYPSGASVLEVAIANNYGLGVPRRPFMSVAAQRMRPMYRQQIQKFAPALLAGKVSPEIALNVVGRLATDIIRKTITTGEWVPNSPETIAQKGSDRPLIDTGHMRMSATYVVRRRTV